MRLDEIPSNSCTLLGIYEQLMFILVNPKLGKIWNDSLTLKLWIEMY